MNGRRRGWTAGTARRRLWTGAAVAALALIGLLLPRPAEQAVVIRVVDGDTLKVAYQGRPVSVRLIGIDTPESRENVKARRDAGRSRKRLEVVLLLGRRAHHFVRGLIKPGERIRLEFDAERRDRYGRLLAYVYLPDGRMLNEVIVRSGFAQPMTYPPNVRYRNLFSEAYREARAEGRGLWKE